MQRIRTIGGGYRELPLYDANPPLTANGTPIPREFVFVETNRMGQPQNAWRIPNDPTLTDRSLGALNGRDVPLSEVPRLCAAEHTGGPRRPGRDISAGANYRPAGRR